MKNFFYSGIALLCFNAFASASTEATKEDYNSEGLPLQTENVKLSDTPCADQWSADVAFFQEYLGVSHRKAMRLADLAFEKCLDDLYGN